MAGPDHRVVVYIWTRDEYDENAKRLRKLFGDRLFITNAITAEDASAVNIDSNAVDLAHLKATLEDAEMSHPNNHIIIVRGDSTSVASPERTTKLIRDMINRNEAWNYFFFGPAQINCSELTASRNVAGVDVADGKRIRSLQVVMITPETRRILQGHELMKNGQKVKISGSVADIVNTTVIDGGLITAFSKQPYITNRLSDKPTASEISRSQVCSDKPLQTYQAGAIQNVQNTANSNTMYWVIGVIVLAIIIAIIVYAVKQNNKKKALVAAQTGLVAPVAA